MQNYFVDITSWFTISFFVAMAACNAFSSLVDWLNSEKRGLRSKLRKLRGLSQTAKELFSFEKITRALKYKNAVDRFNDMASSIGSTANILCILFGVMPFVVATISSTFPHLSMVWCWIATLAILTVLTQIATMPFEHYMTFGIEERFGFNKTTKATFYSDKVKSVVVGLVFMVPIQLFMGWALGKSYDTSVFGVFLFIAGILVVGEILKWIFVNCVMPMFNKFSPLNDEALEFKLKDLCAKCNFKVSAIEVMDASRRSSKSNAFICGYFGKKKIVFFDTILKNMTHDEILAIIGHEIGHGKLHHLLFNNLMTVVQVSVYVTLSFVLMKVPEFYHAFGYSWVDSGNVRENLVIGFALASTFLTAFMWILHPFMNWISRRMEHAADLYSAKMNCNPQAMVDSLLRITSENLADLFPHPVYEFVNDSHPSVVPRVEAIVEKIQV